MPAVVRRDVTPERLFFLLVLLGVMLLVSGLMVRHEGALSSRTFRDGFTVAEGVRRTEMVSAAAIAVRNATEAPSEEDKDVRMTTIKTEDGDEITIKRAGTSKGKVTTISRDEKGKLTIEDTTEEKRGVETDPLQTDDRLDTLLGEDETQVPGFKLDQKGDDVGENEGREDVAEEEGKEEGDDTEDGKQAVIVSRGKKVTVVKVNESLTKVRLSDVEEPDGDEETGDAR